MGNEQEKIRKLTSDIGKLEESIATHGKKMNAFKVARVLGVFGFFTAFLIVIISTYNVSKGFTTNMSVATMTAADAQHYIIMLIIAQVIGAVLCVWNTSVGGWVFPAICIMASAIAAYGIDVKDINNADARIAIILVAAIPLIIYLFVRMIFNFRRYSSIADDVYDYNSKIKKKKKEIEDVKRAAQAESIFKAATSLDEADMDGVKRAADMGNKQAKEYINNYPQMLYDKAKAQKTVDMKLMEKSASLGYNKAKEYILEYKRVERAAQGDLVYAEAISKDPVDVQQIKTAAEMGSPEAGLYLTKDEIVKQIMEIEDELYSNEEICDIYKKYESILYPGYVNSIPDAVVLYCRLRGRAITAGALDRIKGFDIFNPPIKGQVERLRSVIDKTSYPDIAKPTIRWFITTMNNLEEDKKREKEAKKSSSSKSTILSDEEILQIIRKVDAEFDSKYKSSPDTSCNVYGIPNGTPSHSMVAEGYDPEYDTAPWQSSDI